MRSIARLLRVGPVCVWVLLVTVVVMSAPSSRRDDDGSAGCQEPVTGW
jgi:hypothetical protein